MSPHGQSVGSVTLFVHDEHRARCVLEHVVGHRTEAQPAREAPTASAEDEQVGPFLGGHAAEGLPGLTALHPDARLHLEVELCQGLLELGARIDLGGGRGNEDVLGLGLVAELESATPRPSPVTERRHDGEGTNDEQHDDGVGTAEQPERLSRRVDGAVGTASGDHDTCHRLTLCPGGPHSASGRSGRGCAPYKNICTSNICSSTIPLMAASGAATILHADLDAFYASVEQLLDPTLRGLPIAVGDGVVLAASYEAKRLGVQAGMASWRARQRCPELRFVGGHFREYQRLGDEVMAVFSDYTPFVERISIDEAFLDVAGARQLFGEPATIAQAIRERVRQEIGLALSIGVARTKHLAKVASQAAKPDGMLLVDPERELEFLAPLPVELMWGVGPATSARLHLIGVRTIGDLAIAPAHVLQRAIGNAAGTKLGSLASNLDPRRVESGHVAKSVGAQAALGRRPPEPTLLRSVLGYLADRIATRLRSAGMAGRTVTVRVRFTGLRSVTRSASRTVGVSATLTLTEVALELVGRALADHPGETEITLLSISVSNLVAEPLLQLELPLGLGLGRERLGTPTGAVRFSLDRSMDAIRSRYGHDAIGYAATVFAADHRVPEEFRELAEHDL